MSPLTALTIPIASSRPEVGTLKPATLTIAPGETRATATFSATTVGTTTLTLTPPAGFVQTNPPAQMVVVVN